MAIITFTSPIGEEIINPPQEQIKDLIFGESYEFWQAASEQAALDFDEGTPKSFLWIKHEVNTGFLLEHGFRDDSYETFLLREGNHTGETIEASIGGEPSLYFREYFVPKEIAWKAIEYFMETGERHPEMDWEIAEMPEE